MKCSALLVTASFLVNAKLGLASPADLEATQPANCTVNRQHIATWHESAQSRRRIAVSSENTPVDKYCRYWRANWDFRNVQCYYNVKVGSYVIDVNTDLGIGGDEAFWENYRISLESWCEDYHCATG